MRLSEVRLSEVKRGKQTCCWTRVWGSRLGSLPRYPTGGRLKNSEDCEENEVGRYFRVKSTRFAAANLCV